MEKVNQWLALAANVGVIAGIVFLGYEIQQNTEQLKSGALRDMAGRMDDRTLLLATNSEIANRVMRMQNDPESLTALDKFHLVWWVISWIADFEEAYRQHQLGAIPEFALTARARNIRRWLETPLGKWAWDESKGTADPDFVRWVDATLGEEVPGWRTRTPAFPDL